MLNEDLKKNQINQLFLELRKVPQNDKQRIVSNICYAFQRSLEYFDLIIDRILEGIIKIDTEDRKGCLMVLYSIIDLIDESKKSFVINKFHSTVFRLFETNTDELLQTKIAKAYGKLVAAGGNKNDSIIESNISSALNWIKSVTAPEIKKASGLMVLKVLLMQSPYTTFKKLFQKDQGAEKENYEFIRKVSQSKSVKTRTHYLSFFEEFAKHISQRSDKKFRKSYFKREFADLDEHRDDNSEQNVHILLEKFRILLIYGRDIFDEETFRIIIAFVESKIRTNKSQVIHRSLISLIPIISDTDKQGVYQEERFFNFMKYLKSATGDDKILAQSAIRSVIVGIPPYFETKEVIRQLRTIVEDILANLKERVEKRAFLDKKGIVVVKILHQVFIKIRKCQLIFTRTQISELQNYVLLHGLYQQSIRFLNQLSRQNIYQQREVINKKLIGMISRILAHSFKKVDVDNNTLIFKEELDKVVDHPHYQSETIKIDAIKGLSIFVFEDKYKDIVGNFVREKIVKDYLDDKNSDIRKVSVEAAFLLYAKRGKIMACNQMSMIIEKILRVGMSDSDAKVRQTVFICLNKNIKAYEGFIEFLNHQTYFKKLFNCITDTNSFIQKIALQILCVMAKENPSDIVLFLKKTLYQYLQKLSKIHSSNYNQKKNLLKFIRSIIKNGTQIIEPHSSEICKLILRYLQDRNIVEAIGQDLFETFSKLAQYYPSYTLPYTNSMTRYVIEAMQDKLNNSRRNTAINTFISIIKNCGFVVIPYCKFSGLRSLIVYLLKSEIDGESRTNLLKILGGLGAVDKFKYRILNSVYEERGDEGIMDFYFQNKSTCNFLKNQMKEIEKERNENPINELRHYYQDLITLGVSTKKPIVVLVEPPTKVSSPFIEMTKTQITVSNSKDINQIVIKCLLQILQDISLSRIYNQTIETLVMIINLLGSYVQPYLKIIISSILKLQGFQIQIMQVLLLLTRNSNVSDYVDDIAKYLIICNNLETIDISLSIMEIFAYKYRGCVKLELESIIELWNKVIKNKSTTKATVQKIFRILRHMRDLVDPYIHIIVPFYCDNLLTTPSEITQDFLSLLMSFARHCSSTVEYLSFITQHLVRLLDTVGEKNAICKSNVMNCFVAFILIYKDLYAVYLPLIHKAAVNGMEHTFYAKCIRYLQSHSSIEYIEDHFSKEELSFLFNQPNAPYISKLDGPQKLIKKSEGLEALITQFDPSQKNQMDDDWNDWLKKTSLQLLKKSPHLVLKACSNLAEQYFELATQLYNIAFLQIWEKFQGDQRVRVIEHIKKVLKSNSLPPLHIRQIILNLCEFMSRHNFFSELEPKFLADAAKEALAYAKTLYFRQELFELNPQRQMQGLIEIYTLLEQPQSAKGLLEVAKRLKIETKISWYQKLQRYQDAFIKYKQSQIKSKQNDPRAGKDNIPKIKCLKEMGHWTDVLKSASDVSPERVKEVADLAVNASIALNRWDEAERWLKEVDDGNENKSFWCALLKFKEKKYDEALININNSRNGIYNQISQLLTFSSNHSSESLLRLQELFELEEMIDIAQFQMQVKKKQEKGAEDVLKSQQQLNVKIRRLKEVWSDRLIGCPTHLGVWQKLMTVRSLMFKKQQYIEQWVEYYKLALKESRTHRDGGKLMNEIIRTQITNLGVKKNPELQLIDLEIMYRLYKLKEEQVISKTQQFIEKNPEVDTTIKAKMYYKCSEWAKQKWAEQNAPKRFDQIIYLLQKCTQYNPQMIKAWHSLGVMHSQNLKKTFSTQERKAALLAMNAFIQSLSQGKNKHKYYLQDCLKLLTIIFDYAEDKTVSDEFLKNFVKVSPDGWIDVVPQIIARLYTKKQKGNTLCTLLREMLLKISEEHPQAVIYPLIFAARSKTKERKEPAEAILDEIKKKNPQLCEEATMISTELCKTAIKLKQFWHEGILAAWTAKEDKNIDKVVKMLKQLHEEEKYLETSNSELAFQQQFGAMLRQAHQWILRFQRTGEAICFSQAFEIYYTIYKKINDSLEGQRKLFKVYLKNVAPDLLSISNCRLCIPGLYNPSKPIVTIQGFHNELTVLQSKQRPRKLTIYGSDGKEYIFLLKGREDLRLDERVMQLMGLINKLMSLDPETIKKDLFVTRYSIIPLSVNTGLIGWVQQCDTLNQLIKQYRTDHKIKDNVEKNLYEKFSDDFVILPLINKVQIFRHVMQSTQGIDLARVLWLKSQNCEAWIQRRTCYTHSLAAMSMVGYILGLGDRHPSNIMIQRQTGKIVHIDFGDCFEVAMLRDKFPEKVPFRLTRMLEKAMQACGRDGNYRFTCETVMNMLRSNKQSLLIVLEAFVYDPIISWGMVNDKPKETVTAPVTAYVEITKQKQNEELFNSIMTGMNEMVSDKKKITQNHHEQDRRLDTPGRYFKTDNQPPEIINEKAKKAFERIERKLTGKEFDENQIMRVDNQVNRLIKEATSYENICQSWPGWCPFW